MAEEHVASEVQSLPTDGFHGGQDRFRKLVDFLMDGVVVFGTTGNIEFVNPAAAILFGYGSEELSGKNVNMLMSDSVAASHEEHVEIFLESGIRKAIGNVREVIGKRKNGSPFQVAISVTEMKFGGEHVFAAIVRDNIERDLTQAALRDSHEMLQCILHASLDGFMCIDNQGNVLDVNDVYCQLSGYTREELLGMRIFDLKADDDSAAAGNIKGFKEGRGRFESVHRRKDGTLWNVEISGTYRDFRGGQILGFLHDITERKNAEEALRIAALVYQHSSEAMLVANAANEIIAINDAFTRVTGYSADEVLGRNPNMLKSSLQSDQFYQAMWKTLNATGQWQGELWDRSKGGDDIGVQLTISTVFDDSGKVVQRVALFSDITEKKRGEALIWDQAHYDTLTRLPNRRMFHDRLQEHIDRASQSGASIALLLIDLDGFKEINDTLGHDKGDILLIEVARRIAECLREPTSLARLGGDEFTVILSGMEDLANAKSIAKKIIAELAAPYRLSDETVHVSASIGIAQFPDDCSGTEELVRHADQAMYAAKNSGRNRFRFFTRELQHAALSRLSLTNELRVALAANQFEVYYQPIVELATGEIRKAEALIRWNHPVRGMVGPVEFIPLAESSGLILEIGEWVFKTAAEQVRRLRSMGHATFQISVNVSPVQFQGGDDLGNMWLNNLGALGLPTQSMVIEITEGLLLDLSAEVKDKLIAFGVAGIQVALDDFGTGYSSLAYLKKFDIDYLKIDRAFVSNLETDSDDNALCEAIIVMAHKLGLRVIAEGVETVAQRELLIAAGCDFAQGYLFSKPVPAALFEQLCPLAGGDQASSPSTIRWTQS